MSQVDAKIISESNLVEIKLYIKRWFILAALISFDFYGGTQSLYVYNRKPRYRCVF